MGQKILCSTDIEEISRIESREALLGKLVCLVNAPLSGLACVLSQKVLSLLYVLKAIEDKKGNKKQTGDTDNG